MSDDHDILHAELVDSDQDTADGGAEGRGYHPSRVLYHLGITVPYAQGGRQKLHQTRIHACDYSNLPVGILAGDVPLVSLILDEVPVELQYIIDHRTSPLIPESRSPELRLYIASRSAGLNVPGPFDALAAYSAEMLNADIAAETESTEGLLAPMKHPTTDDTMHPVPETAPRRSCPFDSLIVTSPSETKSWTP